MQDRCRLVPLPMQSLAHCLPAALALPPASNAFAGTLDGTEATIEAGTPIEEWTIRNGAWLDLQGAEAINATSASIDSDSTWLMTGDSNVGHLALGNGSTFNTLSVDTFDGAGGTLLFNTQLGDDSSATDKLIVKGDANGQANVRVLNAGGAGAKTEKGIGLIRVGGASNAQFDLQDRAVGLRSLGDSGLSGRVGLRLQGEGRSAAGASVRPHVVANRW